jgi:hypothetical protein
MTLELRKDFTGIRHDVGMSGFADPEGSWFRRREVARGALQWR